MAIRCKLLTLMGQKRYNVQDVYEKTGLSRTIISNLYHDKMQRVDYETLSKLCTDLLSTEKHVSSVYNICVFEFRDTNIRDTLNHIQKEEQQHGEQIYNYMSQNGMYN